MATPYVSRFKIGDNVTVVKKRSVYNNRNGVILSQYMTSDHTLTFKVMFPDYASRWFSEAYLVMYDDLPDDGRKDKWL